MDSAPTLHAALRGKHKKIGLQGLTPVMATNAECDAAVLVARDLG